MQVSLPPVNAAEIGSGPPLTGDDALRSVPYGVPVRAISPPMRRPSRRSVVLAAAVAALTACTTDDGTPSPTASPSPTADPDALVRAAVARAERDMVRLYEATSARHPALAGRLAAFTARHRRHLDTVELVGTPDPVDGTTSAESPSAPADETPAVPTVAADPAAAVNALRVAERAAADARITDCLRAEQPALAETLASIAACEAAHDMLLAAAT